MTDIVDFAGRQHRSSYQGNETPQQQQQQPQQQQETGGSLSSLTQPEIGDSGSYLPGVNELEAFSPPTRPWSSSRMGMEPMLGGGFAERNMSDSTEQSWASVNEYGSWGSGAPGARPSIAGQRRLQHPSSTTFSSNYGYGPTYSGSNYSGAARDSFPPSRSSYSTHPNAPYPLNTQVKMESRSYGQDSPYTASSNESNLSPSPMHPLPPSYPPSSTYGSYPVHPNQQPYPPHQSYLPPPNVNSSHQSQSHPSATHSHPQHPYQPPNPTQSQSAPSVQSSQQPPQPAAPPRPPRPANAFMLYRRDHQRQIRLQNSRLTNNEVSTLVGEMWRHEKESIKDEYRQRAAQGRVLHYAMYPDYQYTVKTGKKKKTAATAAGGGSGAGAVGGGKMKSARRASTNGSPRKSAGETLLGSTLGSTPGPVGNEALNSGALVSHAAETGQQS